MTRATTSRLLAGAAALAAPAVNAWAQPPMATSGAASDSPAAAATEIVVTARSPGASALTLPVGPNAYRLTKSAWNDALAGENALSLVKDIPGVAYTATDALGVDISDASLFVRGFHMNELAIVFERVPLNDTSFGSLTGTSLVNVAVPDGIASIDVAPGAARESTFSSSDNGGGLVYALAKVRNVPSLSLSQSYGSDDALVTTASAQSGRLWAGGPAVLADFQRISADKYEGGGTQNFLRGDLKLRQEVPWGEFTTFFSATHAAVWGYNNLSFDMIRNLGWRSDSWYPDYAFAYNIALPENASAPCGPYSCGKLASLVPYDTGQSTSDYIGAVAHTFRISTNLTGDVQLYGVQSSTAASLADPTTPSPTGAPFSEQVQRPHVRRYGGTANLKFVAGPHTITAGLWLERADSAARTSWYSEPLLGSGAPLKTVGPYDLYGPAFQTANDARWRTLSRQAYLHDDIALSDRLVLGIGFKGVDFSTAGGGVGPDAAPRGHLSAHDAFLPHLSAVFKADARTSVFIDLAETESGYRVAERGNIGYTASAWTVSNQDLFDTAAPTLRPEKDWNFTTGVSHHVGPFSMTADAYYSRISNRLISAAVGSQFAQVNTVGEVPSMHIVGGDLGTALDVLKAVHLHQALALTRSAYDSDLTAGGATFPIRGKAQPGYPVVSLVSDATLKLRDLQLGASSTEYLDEPFSYQNDIYVPTFWQVNAYAVYNLPRRQGRPPLSLRFDVNNLLQRKNIGTATIAGSPFSGDYQTLQRAPPRQILFTVSARY